VKENEYDSESAWTVRVPLQSKASLYIDSAQLDGINKAALNQSSMLYLLYSLRLKIGVSALHTSVSRQK
jgi:hypothetical protein